MEHSHFIRKYLNGPGVEIGAFKTPIPGIRPVYVDRFAEYAGDRTLADYYGDACDLPFRADSLQYVATSHVLEHVANPLAAIAEWFRSLRHGGYIYMVIPDRRRTFDHPRKLTDVSHMVNDFHHRVNQCDGTHIDDFVFGVDWSLFSPATPKTEEKADREELALRYHRAIEAGLEINIHFHTFESGSAVELIHAGNTQRVWDGEIEVMDLVEAFPGSNPNGFLIIAKVRKPLRHRWRSLFERKGLRSDARKMRKAEQVARANAHSRHASCYRNEIRMEAIESWNY